MNFLYQLDINLSIPLKMYINTTNPSCLTIGYTNLEFKLKTENNNSYDIPY